MLFLANICNFMIYAITENREFITFFFMIDKKNMYICKNIMRK